MNRKNIEYVNQESIIDPYLCCKYLERRGIPIDEVTLGNVHDVIEEMVDDNHLPVTQVTIENAIEGYIIGA